MLLSSEKDEFELALKYRENLESLEKIKLKRTTALDKFIDADVIAHQDNGIYSTVSLIMVRKGITLGIKNFDYESVAEDRESLVEFITGYYKENSDIPSEIIVGDSIDRDGVISGYFKKFLNKSVKITKATRGVRKNLLDMATINAKEHLETAVDKIKHKTDMTVNACKHLQEKLKLKNFPYRIECYDISNVSGVDKVGSMTVMINGKLSKDFYRRFKIKTVEGADDYKSHQEMMARRLEKLKEEPDKFPKPDLIVIDGGKGQLSSVKEIFDKFNITDIDLIALAEREEEIFTLEAKEPVVLPKSDYALKMLIRIRDEAHRFALTYFRTLHGKNSLTSVLDGIKGLGKQKRKALIEKFKDLGGILKATKEQLLEVQGIGENLAVSIIEKLKEEGLK